MPEGTTVRSQAASFTQPNHNPKPFEDRLLLLSIDEVYSQAAGYPFGLAGEKIPLLSRIIAIAREFDARVSRTDLLPLQALELASESIVRQRGCAFDPVCVDAFVKHRAFLTLGFSKQSSD